MGYIGRAPVPRASRHVKTLTTVGGETSIPFQYTPQAIDVFENGVLLSPERYTATDGQNVVFPEPYAAGVTLTLVGLTTFESANHHTKEQAHALFMERTAPQDAAGNRVWTAGNLRFELTGTTLNIITYDDA